MGERSERRSLKDDFRSGGQGWLQRANDSSTQAATHSTDGPGDGGSFGAITREDARERLLEILEASVDGPQHPGDSGQLLRGGFGHGRYSYGCGEGRRGVRAPPEPASRGLQLVHGDEGGECFDVLAVTAECVALAGAATADGVEVNVIDFATSARAIGPDLLEGSTCNPVVDGHGRDEVAEELATFRERQPDLDNPGAAIQPGQPAYAAANRFAARRSALALAGGDHRSTPMLCYVVDSLPDVGIIAASAVVVNSICCIFLEVFCRDNR